MSHNPLWKKPVAPSAATVAIETTAKANAAPPPRASATRSRSYADLLQKLYEQFDGLADDIAASDAPPHQRADALSKLARSLPLIAAAEQAAKTKVRNKDVTALTDAELQAAVASSLGFTKQVPLSEPQAAELVPAPSQNKKNRSEASVPHLDTSDDEA